ncbi:hypothetical protein [Burkholderia pseudomultivorans]|nr:hypothetical protein [Burkholderia pseudomultivorans]
MNSAQAEPATTSPSARTAPAVQRPAGHDSATPPVSHVVDNRRRTGRNIQKNFKLTAQNIVDLEFEAAAAKITFGEVVERGIAAIRKLREMGVTDY